MIDAKSAVGAARTYVKDVQDILGSSLDNLRLEEVELSEDERNWLVTFGYDNPNKPENLSNLSLVTPELARLAREYKVLSIDADSGSVKSMKSRKV